MAITINEETTIFIRVAVRIIITVIVIVITIIFGLLMKYSLGN